jgi:hypothetical protein
MFEDFRKQAEDANFLDEIQEEAGQQKTAHKSDGRFFGMTPVQRFIIALMLLFMIIILGTLFLLVTSKIELPF